MSDAIIRINDRALQLGAFRLTAIGLTVKGKPSHDAWQQCGAVLQRMEGAVQWWIGDWLNYGEKTYGETYAETEDVTGIDYQTLRNYKWVAGQVALSLRRDNLPYSIHKEIAHLEPPQQAAILDRAEREQLTVREVRDAVRGFVHAEKVAAITAGRLNHGEYDIVAADPPWTYDNSGFQQSAAEHYPVMDVDAIATLPARDPSFPKFADSCVLFLWATSPLLPEATVVLASWGFTYKACLVWVKDRAPGLGWWLNTRHELLLIGARGASLPLERVDSVIEAAVSEHSRKPTEAYAAIDRMFPGLRRVECFAREPRDGWDVWGNEV